MASLTFPVDAATTEYRGRAETAARWRRRRRWRDRRRQRLAWSMVWRFGPLALIPIARK
jgi:hypothetical protein